MQKPISKPAISKSTVAASVKSAGLASTFDWLIAEGHATDLQDAKEMVERALGY